MSNTYLNLDDTGLEVNGVKQDLLLNPENIYHPSYYSKLYGKKKYAFANTLYAQFFIQKYLPIENSLRTISKTNFKINKINYKQVLLLDMDLHFKYGFKIYLCLFLYYLNIILSWIKFFVYSGISFLVAFKSCSQSPVTLDNNLIIANCSTSYSKLNKYFINKKNNLKILVDPIQVKNEVSFFNLQSRFNLLKLIIPSFKLAYSHYIESNELIRLMTNNKYGDLIARDYLSKRVHYTALFELVLQKSLQKSKVKTLFSGVRDERYGYIMQKICNKLSIETVCIPHGLAYAYKYPNGVFGNTYFAYSKLEANKLSEIYSNTNQKFTSESDSKKNTKFQPKYDLVYFTNSRDVPGDRINICNLLTYNKTLMLRLHPNDQESNYKDINGINFVDNFSDSISAKYIVSKPSTVLLEGLKNGSMPIALLLSRLDVFSYEQYPAFNDNKIKKIYSFNELKNHLT